jgi:integrase
MSEHTGQDLEQLANLFFGHARSIEDTRQKKFCAEYKVSDTRLLKALPAGRWGALQDQWARARIRPTLEETYDSAVIRNQFSLPLILKRLQGTGITRGIFLRIAGDEWRKRRAQLPTVKDKVLLSLSELVASQIPAEELTFGGIFKKAGVPFQYKRWLHIAVLEARRKLLGQKSREELAKPPDGVRGLTLQGGWVNLDADVWDLRSGGGSCIKRDLLRSDIAEIAWTQLKNDLIESHMACITVWHHYIGYRRAGELLGGEIPDVREATLEGVQRAWLKYKGTPQNYKAAGAALRRIFTHLYSRSIEVPSIDRREMLFILGWLYSSTSVRPDASDGDFLSEKEMDALIIACLTDIKAGLQFTEAGVHLLNLSTRRQAKDNAAVVVNWSTALMLLLMLFTGLRRESVVKLKVSDLAELHPNLYVVIWSHGKKREENIAILPKTVALLIYQYIERTAELREALCTDRVFLNRDSYGYWSADQKVHYLKDRLSDLTKRYAIERDGEPLALHSIIIRRTYVTRELYMGRSIWALRLQLGHSSILTTRRYGKLDLYEHPGQVGAALDEYGRKTLPLWHRPVLLANIDPTERFHLLGLKKERDQDVGMCRHDSCIKISMQSPPPCSLCEHLVTGPEYSSAWEKEQEWRESDIARLQSTPGAEELLVQKRCQYELFKENLVLVKGDERR